MDVLQLPNQVVHKCDLHVGLINTKFRLLQLRLFAKNCVYCEMAMVKTSVRHNTVVNASFQRNPYLICPYNTCGDCVNRKKSCVCGICNTDHKTVILAFTYTKRKYKCWLILNKMGISWHKIPEKINEYIYIFQTILKAWLDWRYPTHLRKKNVSRTQWTSENLPVFRVI